MWISEIKSYLRSCPPFALVNCDRTISASSGTIIAAWAASAYPTDVWLGLGAAERSAAIYRELRKLDAACDAREGAENQTNPRHSSLMAGFFLTYIRFGRTKMLG
jgi:hypothetical protein